MTNPHNMTPEQMIKRLESFMIESTNRNTRDDSTIALYLTGHTWAATETALRWALSILHAIVRGMNSTCREVYIGTLREMIKHPDEVMLMDPDRIEAIRQALLTVYRNEDTESKFQLATSWRRTICEALGWAPQTTATQAAEAIRELRTMTQERKTPAAKAREQTASRLDILANVMRFPDGPDAQTLREAASMLRDPPWAPTKTCESDAVTAQACVKERRTMHATIGRIREALGVPADATESEMVKRIRALDKAMPYALSMPKGSTPQLLTAYANTLEEQAESPRPILLREVVALMRLAAHEMIDPKPAAYPDLSDLSCLPGIMVTLRDIMSQGMRPRREDLPKFTAAIQSMIDETRETREILGTTANETMGESARRVISELDAAKLTQAQSLRIPPPNLSALRMIEIRDAIRAWLTVETREAERPRSRTMLGRALDTFMLRLATERALTLHRVLGLFPPP